MTLALKDPLEQALRFLRPLERVKAKDVETWRLKAEVEVRRGAWMSGSSASRTDHRPTFADDSPDLIRTGKYLSAAQALRTAYTLDASAPALLPTLIRLALDASSATPEPAAVATALSSSLAALFGGSDVPLAQFVDAQLQKNPASTEYLLQAAEAKRLLGAEHEDSAKELVLQLVKNEELKPSIKVRLALLAALMDERDLLTHLASAATLVRTGFPREPFGLVRGHRLVSVGCRAKVPSRARLQDARGAAGDGRQARARGERDDWRGGGVDPKGH